MASGPAGELRDLCERLQAGNPDLYRHQALYLQVLRQVLPIRVERACFHLATQLQPRRYAALPPEDRRQLHRRLNALVQRCASLLTVEQLCSLAAQMARVRQRLERRRRHDLLRRLPSAPLARAGAPGSARPGASLPLGSVDLDGGTPTSASLAGASRFGAAGGGWGRLPAASLREEAEGEPPTDLEDDLETPGADLRELPGPTADLGVPDAADETADAWSPFARGLPPLFQVLAADAASAPASHSAPDDLWIAGQLPGDPPTLLRWLDGLDQALARRLRNLSHAINVELLRVGLSGSLLPVSLLDAVLSGQLEPQPAPPNLLRLQLPFAPEDAVPLQVMAVLLRSVDLELEEPRLRTCRRRLQQHRQEVRRMAQQFRRLERRREAHEAEQLWLQDRHDSHSPPD